MAGADDLLSMEFGGMAGEDEDVIVSLPGDTTQVIKDGDGVIVKTGGTEGDKKNEDPIDDLKGQFAAMTARATTAERIAQQASEHAQQTSQRLQQVEGQVVSSQLDTVLSGIAAAEAEASNAEKDFIAAAEAGDFAAQARAQRAMSAAEARKQRLSEAKDDLDDAIKTRPVQREPQRQQPQQHTDPVERLIANGGIKGRSADWIRAHPIVATDPKANARMMAAHNLAVADDIPLDSDEYFQRIEAGVNKTAPVQQQRQPSSDGRRPSSAAAPASGSGGSLAGGTDVRLTRGEAASATDGTLVWNYDDPTGQKRFTKGQPIGLAEMARRKLEGKKAGLYDKSASE